MTEKRAHGRRAGAPRRGSPTSLSAPGGPEAIAHAAIEKASPETLPGRKVKLELTVYLTAGQAERLTAEAIRTGRNLEGLASEILESWSPEARGLDRTPHRP